MTLKIFSNLTWQIINNSAFQRPIKKFAPLELLQIGPSIISSRWRISQKLAFQNSNGMVQLKISSLANTKTQINSCSVVCELPRSVPKSRPISSLKLPITVASETSRYQIITMQPISVEIHHHWTEIILY